jgi:N utilization substance protein B
VGRRTKARECAFQILYQWDMTREPIDHVLNLFWKVRSGTPEMKKMAERLARGAHGQAAQLDEAVTAALTNWRFDRVAGVDRNIMRLAAYELVNERDTPASVIIDEAVEMAKRFGEADSPPFVNGVLDAVKTAVRGAPEGKSARARKVSGP